MALGDLEVKGNAKIVGTTEMAGGAKDTTLITNLNADQIDSADKDTDGTLSADSDAKIPSQKAVKTYADARKAECVILAGDQTVAGVKTFSSIPILPGSDPTTDNQAVRKAYLDSASTVVHTTGNETIDGIKTFSKQIAMSLGLKANGGCNGEMQENSIFDTLAPFIPNVDDTIQLHGVIVATDVYIVVWAKRYTSTSIILHCFNLTDVDYEAITIVDGSTTIHGVCLAW